MHARPSGSKGHAIVIPDMTANHMGGLVVSDSNEVILGWRAKAGYYSSARRDAASLLMFGFRCDRSRRPRRGSTAALALAGVLVCSLGVPLPTLGFKRSSQPYPCEHHACGCIDAEHCWRDCCCMTNVQKLAWAQSHGVTPPAFVVAAAKHEQRAAQHMADNGRSVTRTASCCSHGHGGQCEHDTGVDQRESTGSSTRVVLMALALRCRGNSVSVSLLPPAAREPGRESSDTARPVSDSAPSETLLYESPSMPVSSPPPRGVSE